jgi:hypothetical protein
VSIAHYCHPSYFKHIKDDVGIFRSGAQYSWDDCSWQ